MSQIIPYNIGTNTTSHLSDRISFAGGAGTTRVNHPLTTAVLRQQWPREHYNLLDEMLRLLLRYYLEDREVGGHQTQMMQGRAQTLVVILEEILVNGLPMMLVEKKVYRTI